MHHLFLIRHGTTQWVEARRVQGATDSPLTERGRDEARLAVEALRLVRFDAVFCSPMGRTRETAAIVCAVLGLEPILLDDLREMDFGRYEGFAYIEPPDGELTFLMKFNLLVKMLLAQLSGETLRNVKKRAARAWGSITSALPEGRILIIAHGVILNALLAHLLTKAEYRSVKPVQLQPCSITELHVPFAGGAYLKRLDDCHHL